MGSRDHGHAPFNPLLTFMLAATKGRRLNYEPL